MKKYYSLLLLALTACAHDDDYRRDTYRTAPTVYNRPAPSRPVIYNSYPAPQPVVIQQPVLVQQPAPVYATRPREYERHERYERREHQEYRASPPVYTPARAPVYVQPAPVYVQPAPVYVQPAVRPVYPGARPATAPVYVRPAPRREERSREHHEHRH